MSKPHVLILGGCGFVGRNLVQYLLAKDLVTKIRVADKVLPATAHFSDKVQEAFKDEKVEFKQSNLTNPGSIARAMTHEPKFDIVINLAAETKLSQAQDVYQEKVRDLAKMCAEEAKKQGIPKWIEISSAYVYKPGKAPSAEGDECKPFITREKFKLEAEEVIKQEGVDWFILRPSIIYGPGDVTGITPRIITGAVYRYIDEKMKFLWTNDFKINTVHVRDVCKAIALTMEKGKPGTVFNLSDPNDTTQGKVNEILDGIFSIKTGFQGSIINALAKKALTQACEQVNEKHLRPWADLTRELGLEGTPLTPFLDQEILSPQQLSVNGSAIVKELGFEYENPTMTKELLMETIDEYVEMKLFPAIDKIPPGGGSKKAKKDKKGDDE